MSKRISVHTKKHSLPVLVLSLILSASLCSSCNTISSLKDKVAKAASPSTSAADELNKIDFDMFSDSVTSDTVSLHFGVADPKALGLTAPAPTLGDVSEEHNDDVIDKYGDYLAALKKIDYGKLDQQGQVTYDVLEYDLEEAIAFQDYYYYSSSFNSITGVQSELPLVLSEYSFDTKQDIDDYLLVLKDLYRYYGDLMEFEKTRADKGLGASDENIQKIIDSCNSFLEDKEDHFMISSFAERLDTVSGLTAAEKKDYIKQNQKMMDDYVFPAYQLLIDGFTDLLGTGKHDGGICNVSGGKEYYALLLKSKTSTDLTVKKATTLIEDAIDENIDLLMNTDFDSDFEEAYNTYNFSEGTIQQNLDYCKDAIKSDFPGIMDHNVTLKQVPSQLEDFFSPAAYLSCRIDDPSENLILTNTAALADYQNVLETIAHEGYPGHLYEAVYHAENIKSYYQRTASFIGYSEGWAEYAAGYIMETSEYDQKLVKYVDAENQIFNTLMPARIDIGVNYQGWTKDDVAKFLSQYNINMQDYTDYCYNMAIEIPCYYMPYCVGHLITSDIMDNAEKEIGKSASLEEIHKAYLDIGPAPFPVIEKYMDSYIENQ